MSSSKIIGCGMLIVLCLISASMGQDELQDMQTPNVEEELLKNVQELLRGIQSMLDPGNETVSENANLACKCSGLRCQCCQRVRFRRIKFNEYCCLTIVYLKSNYGFRANVRCGKFSLSKEISLRNPLPICVGVPYLTKGASICLQLNDLRKHNKCVHGCATLLGRLFFVTIAKVRLGCFNFYYLDQAAEQKSALEPTSYEPSYWIAPQQDTAAAMPVYEDDVVMMKDIEQPL